MSLYNGLDLTTNQPTNDKQPQTWKEAVEQALEAYGQYLTGRVMNGIDKEMDLEQSVTAIVEATKTKVIKFPDPPEIWRTARDFDVRDELREEQLRRME